MESPLAYLEGQSDLSLGRDIQEPASKPSPTLAPMTTTVLPVRSTCSTGYRRPLILTEIEKTNSSHDIRRSMKGNFTECLWLSNIQQFVSSYTCLDVYSHSTGQ